MCECVRATRGARGLSSGVTPVISQEPRAGARIAKRRILGSRQRVSRTGVSEEKRQRAGKWLVGVLGALLGSQEQEKRWRLGVAGMFLSKHQDLVLG